MKILGLAGIKLQTKNWLQELLSPLCEPSSEFTIVEYRHWFSDHNADAQYEAERLDGITADLVIAKSLGTVIATLAFATTNFRPQKAVFVGSPLRPHSSNNYALLAQFVESVPTLFIQQSSDPLGTYSNLKDAVQAWTNGTIVEVRGDDHVYSNIDELQNILRTVLRGDA